MASLSDLSKIFNSAHDDVNFDEMDVIEIASPQGKFQYDDYYPANYSSRVINFQIILETGLIPQESFDHDKYRDVVDTSLYFESQYIDWESDDAFTRALEHVKNVTFDKINQDPKLQALLFKSKWDRDDRMLWERDVSTIISEELDRIPGLDQYRITQKLDGYPTADYRATRLNDLSEDMENHTYNVEFDCEVMSAAEGVILQQVDNHFLPDTSPRGDYRVSSNYFYGAGVVNYYMGELAGHAYIISSATGNIIEATRDPSNTTSLPYTENTDHNYSFEKFVRGEMAVLTNGYIYGSSEMHPGDIAKVRIAQGEIDVSHVYNQIDPEWANSELKEYPPEIASLAEIKKAIVSLSDRSDLEYSSLRGRNRTSFQRNLHRQFDEQVKELIEDGGIFEVVKFLEEARLDLSLEADEAEIGTQQGPDISIQGNNESSASAVLTPFMRPPSY